MSTAPGEAGAWKGEGMKECRFTVVLTGKELNYLDSALRSDIRQRQAIIDEWGKDHGNVGNLQWLTQRLAGKLRRIHYPPRGVPRVSREIAKMIRKAAGPGRGRKK